MLYEMVSGKKAFEGKSQVSLRRSPSFLNWTVALKK